MANNRIPTFQKDNQFGLTELPSPENAAASMIGAFAKFSSGTASIAESVNKETAKQDRQTLNYNIANSYESFAFESMKNPNANEAVNDFRQKAQDYGQQLHSDSNAFNKSYVNNLTAYYGNHYLHTLEKNATTYTLREHKIETIRQNDGAWNQILSEVQQSQPNIVQRRSPNNSVIMDENGNAEVENTQFNSSHALLNQYISGLRSQVEQGMMTPEAGEKAISNANFNYRKEVLTKGYQDHLHEGKQAEYIKSVLKMDIPGYSMADKTALVASFGKEHNAFVQALGISEKDLLSEGKDQISNLKRYSGMVNQNLNEKYSLVFPDRAKSFEQQQKMAIFQHDQAQFSQTMSPLEQQSWLSRFQPVSGSDNFNGQSNFYHDLKTQVDQLNAEYEKDPVSVEIKKAGVNEQFKNWQMAKNAGHITGYKRFSPFGDELTNPYDTVIANQEMRGIKTPSVVSDAVAVSEVNKVNNLSPQETIDYFNKWRMQFGSDKAYEAYVNQLHSKGMPSKLGFLASFDPFNTDANDIATALKIPLNDLADQVKSKDVDGVDMKTFNTSIGNAVYNRDGSKEFNEYMDAQASYAGGTSETFQKDTESIIRSLAYHYYLTGKETSPEAAVDRAEKNIAGRYNVESIGGYNVTIPNQYTPSNVKDYALRATVRVTTYPFALFTGTQFGALSPEGAKDEDWRSIMNGHWTMSDDRQGLVWVDQQGLLRTDQHGKPLTIDFKDAETNAAASPSVFDMMEGVRDKYNLGTFEMFGRLMEKAIPPGFVNNAILNNAERPHTNAEVHSSNQHVSGQGVRDYLKETEAFRPVAYQDSNGTWTIGYGHTGNVKPGMTVSQSTADKWFKEDVHDAERAVRKSVKVPLNHNQFDALVSFAFNIGEGAFADSTLVKRLNKGDYDSAKEELPRWNKTKGSERGLTKRRQQEIGRFYKPVGG